MARSKTSPIMSKLAVSLAAHGLTSVLKPLVVNANTALKDLADIATRAKHNLGNASMDDGDRAIIAGLEAKVAAGRNSQDHAYFHATISSNTPDAFFLCCRERVLVTSRFIVQMWSRAFL